MAKVTMPKGPSKSEQRRWMAEDLVNRAMKHTPAYKAALRVAEHELAKAEKAAIKPLSKKAR